MNEKYTRDHKTIFSFSKCTILSRIMSLWIGEIIKKSKYVFYMQKIEIGQKG